MARRNRQRARDRKLQQPLRENVPGELDHSSGEVEEVEASIVAGAGGVPAEPEADAPGYEPARAREATAVGLAEEDDEDDAALEPSSRAAARRAGPQPGGNPAVNFLRASWAELQRVQWPDRRQVAQATAVVLGFVIIAGVYLGVADKVAQQIVDAIL